MIVNYRASTKTRAPFCGLTCCGNHFGRCDRSCFRHDSRMNRKILMRRYAKHADSMLVRREIQLYFDELEQEFWDSIIQYQNAVNDDSDRSDWDIFDDTIEHESHDEKYDSRDIDDALDREHWIREGELRDEYYSNYEE